MRTIVAATLILVGSSGLCRPAYTQSNEEGKPDTPNLRLYDVAPAQDQSSIPPEETEGYLRVTQADDDKQRLELIEDFLKKYPESRYAANFREWAVMRYQQENNYEKMVEHGEKLLELNPQHLIMLTTLANAHAIRGNADKAIDESSRAISFLDKLVRPPNADEAKWTAERDLYLAINYSTLGSAHVTKFEEERKKKQNAGPETASGAEDSKPQAADRSQSADRPAADSTPEAKPDTAAIQLAKAYGYLTRSVELNPRSDFAQFQIGVVFAYQNQAAKAMDAFAKSVVLNGGLAEASRRNLEAIYKITHKNSLEGLDQLLAKAKESLGPLPETPAPVSTSPTQPQ
ncbi:MAG: hypothetical protein AB1898_10210 [Acidobacteriota bacterium]